MMGANDAKKNWENFSLVPENTPSTILEELSCLSCSLTMVETSTYRCNRCFQALPPQDTLSDQVFCENCILVHIRKRHEVIDCRGYSPKVCEKHQNLCLMYCSNCETVFCFNCLGPHCKHDFTLVSEKASEIRKEIFNYLDRFEKLSKSMAFRETDILNFAKHNEDLYPGMKPEHLNDFLTNRFSNVLKTNQSQWANLINWDKEHHMETKRAIETVREVNGRAGDRITDLRKLLSLSDGVCVSTFLESKLNYDASIEEQNSELEVHTVQTWCNSLDNLIKFSIESALKSWHLPKIDRRKVVMLEVVKGFNRGKVKTGHDFGGKSHRAVNPPFMHFFSPINTSGFHQYDDSVNDKKEYDDSDICSDLFDFSISDRAAIFNSLIFDRKQKSFHSNKKTTKCFWREEKFSLKCDNESSYVFRYGNEVAMLSNSSRDWCVSLYNLDACKVPNHHNANQSGPYSTGAAFGHIGYQGINSQSHRNAPQKLILTEHFYVDGNVTPLAFVRSSSSKNRLSFSVILWSLTNGSLHFQPEKLKFPCESKPSAIHYTEKMLAFAEKSGTVTIVYLKSRLSVKVRALEHGMKEVNNLRFLKIDGNEKKGQLVMFGYAEKLCVVGEFSLDSVFNLKFSIVDVCRFNVPPFETVSLMTVLCGNVVIVTKDNIYPVGLPFRDGSNSDETELYFNDESERMSEAGFYP